MRRLRLLAPALLLLVATLAVAWAGADLPPPLWLLRYGLPSSQGPTGRVARVEGIDFVEISPGYFRMGSRYLVDHPSGSPAVPGDVAGRLARPIGIRVGEHPVPSEEMPVHWVEFPRGFWIARTEVTREQYGDEHRRPNEGRPVTWREADAFCRDLAARTGLPIRLPSESEWECACRAGTRTAFEFGEGPSLLSEYAWHPHNSKGVPAPEVATKRANRWGLHDFYGNLAECCADWWHPDYEEAPSDGSAWVPGPQKVFRVLRGQAYGSNSLVDRFHSSQCRSACLGYGNGAARSRYLGVRPGFSLAPDEEGLVEPYLVEGAR